MIHLQLTIAQKKVIREICEIEIDSLTEMLEDGPDDESTLLLQQTGSTIEEYNAKIKTMRDQFFEIQKNPEDLFKLDEDNISLFRHILFNLEEADEKPEDCITIKYPQAIKNLWSKLFAAEEFKQLTSKYLSN